MPLGVTSKSQYKLLLSLKDNCQRSKPCVPVAPLMAEAFTPVTALA